MAFLEDLDKKLTMLGQGAIQKTKEVTDSAKLSSAIRNLEIQQKDAYGELGVIYYKERKEDKEGITPAAEEVIRRIEELQQQISARKEEMLKAKGTIFCPNCNTEIPGNSLFCNVCGTKIERQAAPNIPLRATGRVCGNCGAPLDEGQEFCIMCGKPAMKKEMDTEQPENKRNCPNCGREVPEGMKFCTSCGIQID